MDLYFNKWSGPSRAVAALAQHLKLNVNIKNVDLLAGETRTPEYLKINPAHAVPTLVDNGFSVSESRAILAYLINKYAPGNSLYPTDAQARANVDKVLFFDASAFMPALGKIFYPIFRSKTSPTQEAKDEFKEKVQILEAILGDKPFFTGDKPTIADISVAVSIPFVQLLIPELYTPKIQAWYERVGKEIPELLKLNNEATEAYKGFITK